MGPLAVLMAHAMMAKLTREWPRPEHEQCKRNTDPLTQEKVKLVGITADPLAALVEEAVKAVKEMAGNV